MPEKTEAQKRAQQKYMEKFAVARVRMEREKYETIQAHAEANGESVNGFINRAIDQTMAQEAVGSPTRPALSKMILDTADGGNDVLGPSEGRTEGIADGD